MDIVIRIDNYVTGKEATDFFTELNGFLKTSDNKHVITDIEINGGNR